MLDRRPLLIGQAPGPSGDGLPPFFGRGSALRFMRVAGIVPETYSALTAAVEPVNLLTRWPGGKRGGGDVFPFDEAVRAATGLREHVHGRRAVLAGLGVARAFGFGGAAPLVPFRDGGADFLILPHPSGMNRWWNDAGNAARAAEAVRAFLAGHL